MSVWRVEANFSGSAGSITASLGPTGTSFGNSFGAGYGITASDGDKQLYLCHVMVHDVEVSSPPVANYHSRAVAGVLPVMPLANLFPLARTPWLGDHLFDLLDGGAAFGMGGLFAIEKDTSTGDLRFITPMGTWNTSCADEGLLTNSQIRPLSVGIWLRAAEYNFPPMTTPQQSVDMTYQDFYGRLNGSIISGAHVSSADPGIWMAWAESDDFSPSIDLTTMQNAGDYDANLKLPMQDLTTFGSIEDAWYREFNGPDVMPMSTTDMGTAFEHGVLWRAAANADLVLIERSFDGGHSWEMFVVFTDPLATNSSPTVNWYNHRLAVTWYDGTNIKEAHSVNGGETWGMPITIPFTGTHPRRLTDITGGGSFYFYFDSGPNLLVVVTYDNGGSYDGPFTVAAGLTAQQIDAEFSPDGSIVASYFVAGVWTQKRSRDLGVTWT